MTGNKTATLFSAKGISKTFAGNNGNLKVLDNLCLTVSEGESVALVGPSGCGKTTFLRIVAGIEMADEGTVTWKSEMANSGDHFSFAFQNLALFPWRTVEENICFPLEVGEQNSDHLERSAKMIEAFGLNGFATFYPSQLSGGMRQRVALARALITNPQMLILDEPFGALDVKARLKLQDLLLTKCSQKNLSLLMVTHDLHEAIRLCERVIVFSQRPASIVGCIETPQWSKQDRMKISATETADYICKLHEMIE